MLQALNDNQAHFVKGRMVFTGRPEDHRPLARRSKAERVAVVYGAVRSLLEDTLGPYGPREYVDERGLAFKLSTYVATSGLARSRGMLYGESRVLLGRARQKLKGSTPLVMYISDASHGTPYRRFQTLAQYLAPQMLPEQIGESYFLSSHMHSGLPVATAITQTDVMQMIGDVTTARLTTWPGIITRN